MTRYIAITDEIVSRKGHENGMKSDGSVKLRAASIDGAQHPFAASAVDTIGTYRWILESHIPLRKLQARLHQTLNAVNPLSSVGSSELCIVINGKNGSVVLVEELILAEVIRLRYEEFVGMEASNLHKVPSLVVDCVCQQENVVSSILEQLLFDSERITSLEFHVLEVTEYVHRKFRKFIPVSKRISELYAAREQHPPSVADFNAYIKSGDELRFMMDEFKLCVSSITMGRCLALHRDICPLSLSSRLFGSMDAISMFCSFIETEPWVRCNPKTGLREKWDNGWRQYTAELCTAEGNCWIAILTLLDSHEIRNGSYELTNARSGRLLKLRRYLTEKTVLQIPQLEQLKRFLEELNLSLTIGSGTSLLNRHTTRNSQPNTAFSIVEIEDLLYDKWVESAHLRVESLPALSAEETRSAATLLAECLESNWQDNRDDLTDDVLKCFLCDEPAESRCSRCKAVVYCGPECQLEHWNDHKKECRK